MRAGQ
jgi:NMT1/THI5 like